MRYRGCARLALAGVLTMAATGAMAADAMAAPADVVVSEIMYNPASDLDADEFLEIWNSGADGVDVGGWCLSGVTYCFPAGTSLAAGRRVVLSPDAARTLATYRVTAFGTYTGSLKNSGEAITLKDAGGATIHTFSFLDVHPWPVLPDGQGPSLELISVSAGADRSDPWDWAASTAAARHTAGAANSVARTGVPPRIVSVTASATRPAAGQAVTVDADVVGQTGSPVLQWRRNLGAWTSVTMASTGGTAWQATIPGQTAGSLVEYRITTQGAYPHQYPRSDDSSPTAGIWYPRTVASGIPVFEWFIRPADYTSMTTTYLFDETDFTFESAMVFDDTVITNARVRVRGKNSRNDPKVSYKWELPQNHDLPMTGRFVEPIDEFAMQADWSDRTYARSMLSFHVGTFAGVPGAQRFPMHVQQNGVFFGLFGMMETFDKTWRERFGFEPAGLFYEANTGAWSTNRSIDKRWEQKSGVTDTNLAILASMVNSMIQLTGTAREQYVRANFDVPQLINYAAVLAINNHIDSSSKNYFAFRSDATGRWSLIPWDYDHTWGNGCNCSVYSSFVTPAEPGDKVNEMMEALLEVPAFKTMYFRRLRTLTDALFVPGLLIGWYDASLTGHASTATLDKARWGFCCTIAQDRTSVVNAIAARRTTILGDARVPAAQTASPPISINELMTADGSAPGQFIELFNPSATETVDVSGWTIAGSATATLQPGSAITPRGAIVVVANDPSFRATFGGLPFVADRFTGSLPASGTLTLARADGSVADSITYGGAGWPVPAAGQSLATIDPLAANDDGAAWAAGTPTPAGATASPPPPPPPTTLICKKTVSGTSAVLTFSGVRGSISEQLRRRPDTWIATTTGRASYTVTNGATADYFVRVRGTGFTSPYQDISCTT